MVDEQPHAYWVILATFLVAVVLALLPLPVWLVWARPEWLALLQQLMLHKQVTFPRLQRITRLEPMLLRQQMSALLRMGLLTENRQGVVEINRYLQHFVHTDLAKRGHLA